MLKTQRFIINEENENLNKTSVSKTSKSGHSEELKIKINLSEIKAKFDNLDLTFNQLYDLSKKISSKQNFYHNFIMTFNQKEINLEEKRDNYSTRINSILNRNYKNLDDLIKSNSKVQNLLKKFQNFSLKNEIRKMYEFPLKSFQMKTEFYGNIQKTFTLIKSFFEVLLTL
jgi:hypothetical protein